jgi:choline dehydrogenase-like flavoprotein
MIIDLNRVDRDPFKENQYDVCICGAGVAGITLALKLSEKLSVVLLEGGGFKRSDKSQAIYKGKTIGVCYFDLQLTRLRYLGGTSNHWAGWCHPMEHHDFFAKPYVQFSGWPIERHHLEPYLRETELILDLAEGCNRCSAP